MKSKIIWIYLLISIGLSFLAYYPALNTPFLLDDFHYLHFAQQGISNPGILFKPYVGFFRPVNHVAWTMMYYAFTTHALWYHLVVILLHGINSFLTGYLCYRITQNRMAGYLATLIFCFNPIQFNTVYWISAFLTSGLVLTFVLLSSLFYYLALTGVRHRLCYILSILFFVCAIGNHESGFLLVFLLPAVHLLNSGFKKLWLLTPFLVIGCLMMWVLIEFSHFRQGQGLDLAGMRYLSEKFHLKNLRWKIRPYGFSENSIGKFDRSLLHILLNPLINWYYPGPGWPFRIAHLVMIVYLLPLLYAGTRKAWVIAVIMLLVPAGMHAGSYFPIIFSRHTYVPCAGQAILLSLALVVLYNKLGKMNKTLAASLLAAIMLGYVVHGFMFIRPEKEFPMHKDALRRHEQVSQLKEIFNQYNQPYMIAEKIPFTPIQLKAISAVFFNKKLMAESDPGAKYIMSRSDLNSIIIKYEKDSFTVLK